MEGNLGTALLLTAGAGLATGIGGLWVLAGRRPGKRFMGFTLGFSAGVMIFVSFQELLWHNLEEGAAVGELAAYGAFLAGMLAFFLLDLAVPHEYIGHHDHPGDASHVHADGRLMRLGLMTALGIGLHNFPEGLATFAGALRGTHMGLAVGGAMALHNIPEGLAVAAPIFAATGSRGKAFGWALLSGLSEPVGAALAALVLWPFLTAPVLAVFTCAVAGIMVAVAVDELLPAAKEFGSDHTPFLGVIAGMAVMAAGLYLLHASGAPHAH